MKAKHANKMEEKSYDLEKEKVMKKLEIEKEITRRAIEVEREKTKREAIILQQKKEEIILQRMKMACQLNNNSEFETEDKHDVGDISRFCTRPQTLM